MTVTFDLCKSTDPNVDKLAFFFDFGDGTKTSGSCIESHTYGSTPLRGTSNVRRFDTSFEMQGCAVDPFQLSSCRTRSVKLVVPDAPPSTPTTPSCPTPTIAITSPVSPAPIFYPGCAGSVMVTAAATNTNAVQFCLTTCPKFSDSASVEAAPGCVAGTAAGSNFVGSLTLVGEGCRQIVAEATSTCGGMATSAPVILNLTNGCFRQKATEDSNAAWSSDLDLDGGRLQVVVNGNSVAYPERGRSAGTTRLQDRENRVEATVLNAAGKAGTWTIDLSGSDSIQAGSIHVLSGEVSSMAGAKVTFRLKGTPGERVSFTFRRKEN
jgi:hypothetical protein